jgi:hypothetical protein
MISIREIKKKSFNIYSEIKWRRESKKLKINNIAWRLNYSPCTGSIKFFLQKHQLWR